MMAEAAGGAERGGLRLDFDRRLMLQFRGAAITSDAGLLPYRELDDALSLTDTGADTLADVRTGKNGRHRLVGLLRQSVSGRLAGYEDVNDADRLCRDPAIRWVVGDRAITGSAAPASQMGRFETKWLSWAEDLPALADLPGQWIDKVYQRRAPKTIVLDMDSSESPTYGEQEGSAYNGHFGCTCYPRCSCSTNSVMSSGARCDPATCTVPVAGARYWSRSRPLPGHREASLFSRRRGVRQSRDVRVPRSRGYRLYDPAAGQQTSCRAGSDTC